MDKQQIEKELKLKNDELATLQADVLSETQKKQKEQLEKDIEELKKQLDELEKLETTATTDKTKKETEALKDVIEADSDWTYELMKESKMHDKLLTVLWSESKVESFALEIDKVVRKYLDQEMEWFSNSIKNSMCVGIQFTMMEALTKQWAEWSTEFFDAFASTKSKSATKAFEWLYKSFGKLWSANEFFVLANKVQNITRYLSDKKSVIAASKSIPELMNPVKFKKLLNNPAWSNQVQIDKLDITKILTFDATTGVELSDADKAELKKIIDNANMPITEKTIASIQKSLKSADKILDSRGKFKDKASDLVDKIAWILDINIPFLGNLGEMMWMKFPTDILGEQKDGGVLNFVLWVLGFRGGLKWLHRKYIKEKLDEIKIDDVFVAASYAAYQKNIDATITNDSETSTWKICALAAPDAKTEPLMKAKIPADYAGLKKSIVDNLDTAKLNPVMVAKFAPEFVTAEADKNIVDVSKITDKNTFVDQYLMYIIPLLADPSDDFISSKKIDKDSFALAVMGGLVWDKYFIEWVNIGLVSATDFKNTAKTNTETVNQWDLDVINGKVDFSAWKFTAEQIKNINYLIDEMTKAGITNPYTKIGILSVISKESGFIPVNELSYGTTPNAHIREIFGDRVSSYSETELDALKKDDVKFFDAVYGQKATAKLWWVTGNTELGDGYKYRGRGFNGITFKSLYKQYGDKIGKDLVTNPDLLNDPVIAAKAALEFFKEWNKKQDLSLLKFNDKKEAAKFFSDINAGGINTGYASNAIKASTKFDVTEKLAA